MEEIEIPIGAMTFYSGMFYKINLNKLFHYKNGQWSRSLLPIKEVARNIKKIPDILESIHGTAIAWDEHNNRRRHAND